MSPNGKIPLKDLFDGAVVRAAEVLGLCPPVFLGVVREGDHALLVFKDCPELQTLLTKHYAGALSIPTSTLKAIHQETKSLLRRAS